MDPELASYVERISRMLAAGGLPPMAGRIWGYLLVCEPADQTASEIGQALGASRGSISGMVRLLEPAGLVHRSTRPGDRREYFAVPPGSITAILESRMPATVAWRKLADEGLELLADRPPEVRARLSEVRDVYLHMERELPAMLERFKAERAANGPSSVPEGTD